VLLLDLDCDIELPFSKKKGGSERNGRMMRRMGEAFGGWSATGFVVWITEGSVLCHFHEGFAARDALFSRVRSAR
jgi:hypothetical protein